MNTPRLINVAVVGMVCGILCGVAIKTLVGENSTNTYIITERGLVSYRWAYCDLGMLTNPDHDNVYNENKQPITCSGTIELTRDEKLAYEQENF